VKDFFRFGENLPLMDGFTAWIDEGYRSLLPERRSDARLYSWRFWSRGATSKSVACGLLKDSSDSLGRNYPLLLLGAGPLKGWEVQWELLPLSFEQSWNQLEYLSAQTFGNFAALHREVQKVNPPSSDWSEFEMSRRSAMESGEMLSLTSSHDSTTDPEIDVSQLSKTPEIVVCLDHVAFSDRSVLMGHWHSLYRSRMKDIPFSVFIGGTVENTFLVFYRRPLLVSDFQRLWSLSSDSMERDGSIIVR